MSAVRPRIVLGEVLDWSWAAARQTTALAALMKEQAPGTRALVLERTAGPL
jgi:hypothetical protein